MQIRDLEIDPGEHVYYLAVVMKSPDTCTDSQIVQPHTAFLSSSKLRPFSSSSLVSYYSHLCIWIRLSKDFISFPLRWDSSLLPGSTWNLHWNWWLRSTSCPRYVCVIPLLSLLIKQTTTNIQKITSNQEEIVELALYAARLLAVVIMEYKTMDEKSLEGRTPEVVSLQRYEYYTLKLTAYLAYI
jgi:hypothetical protein